MLATIHLDQFHGPLDLLLHLVRKQEVNVTELSLSLITDQFLEHLDALEAIDVESAGDFLITAATLLEIKARAILPKEEVTEDEFIEEPRRELVRRLLEYRHFKDAAQKLEACAESRSLRLPRLAPDEPTLRKTLTTSVEIWDLVGAFARLLRETRCEAESEIVEDDTPQYVHEEMIRRRIAEECPLPFDQLFTAPYRRSRLIGIFLALLELVKGGFVGIIQEEPFGPILLVERGTAEFVAK